MKTLVTGEAAAGGETAKGDGTVNEGTMKTVVRKSTAAGSGEHACTCHAVPNNRIAATRPRCCDNCIASKQDD